MKTIRGVAGAGFGLAAYAFYEPYRYRLAEKEVVVGSSRPPLTVLHLADMHLHRRSAHVARWLRAVPSKLEDVPDFVVCTGDMIEDNDGIDLAVNALEGFEARFGKFYVFGSHDYYQSQFKPLTRYFDTSREPRTTRPADTEKLRDALDSGGWISLMNKTHVVESPWGRIRVAGVDDPYLKRHTTDHIERRSEEVAAIALVHAPDVVSEWILAGFDLVLAGHTHAGQLRLPGLGALVTNCSLPAALAGGLHRVGSGWLHVSPGLGTGKYAPVRLFCRPEATLLRLRPARP